MRSGHPPLGNCLIRPSRGDVPRLHSRVRLAVDFPPGQSHERRVPNAVIASRDTCSFPPCTPVVANLLSSTQGNVEGWKQIANDANSGIGNIGACCAEMDLWEANRESFALTPHPCSTSSFTTCSPSTCGGTYGDDRYAGVCDADGCDLAPFRHGNTEFYGPAKTINTNKKFTVVTQFKGSGTSLTAIKQYFIQDGKKFEVPGSKYVNNANEITESFCKAAQPIFKDAKKFEQVGGLAQMGKATGNPMVLTLSIWDDGFANMLWLDGERYPTTRSASEPGVPRGRCALTGSDPATVREKFRNAKVTYSNIKFGPIGSTYTL